MIKEFAQKQGKSTNKFINEAIEKAMEEQEGDACLSNLPILLSPTLYYNESAAGGASPPETSLPDLTVSADKATRTWPGL